MTTYNKISYYILLFKLLLSIMLTKSLIAVTLGMIVGGSPLKNYLLVNIIVAITGV